MVTSKYIESIRQVLALGTSPEAAAVAVRFLGQLLALPGAPSPAISASKNGCAVVFEWWKSSDVLLAEISSDGISGKLCSGSAEQKLGCGRQDDGALVLELVGAWGNVP